MLKHCMLREKRVNVCFTFILEMHISASLFFLVKNIQSDSFYY